MDTSSLTSIHWQKFELIFELTQNALLPEFKGTTIRGLLGNSIKRANCLRDMPPKEWCAKECTCPYGKLFERYTPEQHKDASKFITQPNPYIVIPPTETKTNYQRGERFIFQLLLIGEATQYHSAVAASMLEMGRIGIGKGRAKMKLIEIKREAIQHWNQLIIPQDFSGKVKVEFISPTKVPRKKVQKTFPDMHIIARKVAERLALLSHFHCGAKWNAELPDQAEELGRQSTIIRKDMTWFQQNRFSHRHDRKVPFGGWMGHIEFDQVKAELYPILQIGSNFNIGKQVTTGLGRFKIEMI